MPISYAPIDDDPEFLAWWYVYPRKQAKGDAKKAWQQTASIRPTTSALIKATRAAMASEQWRKEGGAYIPLPATWLRNERWEDSYTVDLSQMRDETGKVCAYCGKPATGSVNGKHACDADWDRAMANEKTNVVQIGSKPQEVIRDKKLESAGS